MNKEEQTSRSKEQEKKKSNIAIFVILLIGIAASAALKFCVREFDLGEFWDEFAFIAPAGWVGYAASCYYYDAKPFPFKKWVLFFVAMLVLSWIFSLI